MKFKWSSLKFWKTKTIGISCNDKIKLSEIPIALPVGDISFCKLNIDLSSFEVLRIDKKAKTITLIEIASTAEITISFKAFDLLFSEDKVPKEVMF